MFVKEEEEEEEEEKNRISVESGYVSPGLLE